MQSSLPPSTVAKILLIGERRCAQNFSTGQKLVGWRCAVGAAVFLYSKPTSRSQTASSQFFVRRCAPRAAVFLYSKRGSRCMAENFYQLALRTPGIWPLYASSRKQIRQMPYFLKYACGRPQILQRLYSLVENLAGRCCLIFIAVLAMNLFLLFSKWHVE